MPLKEHCGLVVLPSLQACPGSNPWSFSGWSLAPCVTPTPA